MQYVSAFHYFTFVKGDIFMTKRKVLAVVSACALLLTMFVSLIPVYAGKPDDTTGWTLGEGSTISGNAVMAGR